MSNDSSGVRQPAAGKFQGDFETRRMAHQRRRNRKARKQAKAAKRKNRDR